MKNCYMTKEQTENLLIRLQTFESALYTTFDNFGYDLNENLGRKNALLSQAQEKELGKIFKKEYGGDEVIIDGAPGKPDIVLKALSRELECKLTSGSGSKYKSFSLQTDYETLKKKQKLDYLYVLTNPAFTKFCVLFFDSLTINDFHPPANGSRGKSRMKKATALEKATVLWGESIDINQKYVAKYEEQVQAAVSAKTRRLGSLRAKLKTTPTGATVEQAKIAKLITNEEERYDKKINAFIEKIDYWKNADKKFSFVMEGV